MQFLPREPVMVRAMVVGRICVTRQHPPEVMVCALGTSPQDSKGCGAWDSGKQDPQKAQARLASCALPATDPHTKGYLRTNHIQVHSHAWFLLAASYTPLLPEERDRGHKSEIASRFHLFRTPSVRRTHSKEFTGIPGLIFSLGQDGVRQVSKGIQPVAREG